MVCVLSPVAFRSCHGNGWAKYRARHITNLAVLVRDPLDDFPGGELTDMDLNWWYGYDVYRRYVNSY